VCQQCWLQHFKQEGSFTCQCGQKNEENPQEPVYFRYFMNILEKEHTPCDVVCDLHPSEYVMYFNKKN
jgi:hypothetical protein